MIKKALEVGYFVKEATSAEDAIDILISGRVHLALLDINLGSSKDGIWLGEMIRVQYKIPFVYLTAYGENDIARKAIATQPDAYLTKPFKEVDLTAAIEIALQKVKESTYKKKAGYS
jgi:CheY-like chemotaxis protein